MLIILKPLLLITIAKRVLFIERRASARGT
jgi:hypothetical protein